ncbi:MAG: Ig domain-containing protein [Clostridia bacterium]|nr:Ig domain-containing protein [Clostridia bacterium]
MQKKRIRLIACLLILAMALQLVACGTEKTAEEIKINRSAFTVKIGQTAQIDYKLTPEDATDTVVFLSADEKIATVSENGLITGIAEGQTVITVAAENVSTTCNVTVVSAAKEYEELPSVNGFKAFPRGGLIGGEGGTYYPIETTADGDNAVTFRGKGGLSWPDTVNMAKPSAMGGYYESALPLDNLTLTWRLDTPIDYDGEYWYAIALEDRNQLFNQWDGEDPTKTLFFMIGLGENSIYLMPHYRDVVDLGESWSYLGSSQGVHYEPGDTITIQMVKTEEAYVAYLNGVCQVYSNIRSPYLYIAEDLFPSGEVWPMAVAHIGNPEAQYEEEYAFTFGLGEPADDLLMPGDAGVEPHSITCNGFTTFPYGGLVGGRRYNNDITLNNCGTTDRVKVTGYGGTNYGDMLIPRSTMGVYSEKKYALDNLEILYSVEEWIQSGNHWYAIALTEENGKWFEDGGKDKAFFFMFAYDQGYVKLLAHHVGNGAAWTHLGTSQGVPAVGGQYSIFLKRVEGGYSVYMRNAEQSDYVLQNFDGMTVIPEDIIDGLLPDGEAYLMAGGYVETYEDEWSFVIGAKENSSLASRPVSRNSNAWPAAKKTVNGFTNYPYGGIIGGTTYNNNITLEDCGGTDRVKVTGYGGTNYGDPYTPRSTMGVYSEKKYTLDGLEILYSVEDWVQSGNHWYAIALMPENGEWFEDNGSDRALFFLFAYDQGYVTLSAHRVGNGVGWTQIGTSQGVPAAGGQYSILLLKTDGGYEVYMKNASQFEYTLQSFNGMTVLPDSLFDSLLPGGKAYLTAGGYVESYTGAWSFILGAHEGVGLPVLPEPKTVNGFSNYVTGGLVGGKTYDEDIQMEDCGTTDRVKVTGRGGTNYGDTTKPRSTMGVYSEKMFALDGLEILYSVEDWIQSGNHWYAIALMPEKGKWFEDNGADRALFFLFAYDQGYVTLDAHYVGNGVGWTQIGRSQGVPATGGQYSIYLKAVDGGYSVYMKNATQTEYTLMNFGGTTVFSDSFVAGLLPGETAYLTAGGYVESYEGAWSFILGAHENMDYPVPGQNTEPPVQVQTVNGFTAFATGGLVGGATYDADIQLENCGSSDRVKVTGRGGTNYGDTTKPRSTMGVYSNSAYAIDGLEILYSVESWIQSGDHWYAFALTRSNDHWFENDGSDCALFFMFGYENGSIVLQAHHIGNGSGWSYIGRSQGVPATGGQYSIYLKSVDGGYSVYMKNATQTEYTLMNFGGTTVLPQSMVGGLFPGGSAYLMAGAYVATYEGTWSFILGAHENVSVALPQEDTEGDALDADVETTGEEEPEFSEETALKEHPTLVESIEEIEMAVDPDGDPAEDPAIPKPEEPEDSEPALVDDEDADALTEETDDEEDGAEADDPEEPEAPPSPETDNTDTDDTIEKENGQ